MHSSIGGKGGGPPKDPFSSKSDLDKGEDGKRSQPPLPPIPPGWGGIPPN
jgi:hypothetical protein